MSVCYIPPDTIMWTRNATTFDGRPLAPPSAESLEELHAAVTKYL